MINVLAFLLTTGDFSTITSNEFNMIATVHHKKNQQIQMNNATLVLFKISRQISRIFLEANKIDKNSLRKIARELWDNLIDLYTDSTTTIKPSEPAPARPAQIQGSNMPYDASSSSGFFSSNNSNTAQQSTVIIPRDQQAIFQNRELIRKLFLLVKNKQVRSLLISILSTIFNIADTQANNEIHSEYRYIWPSSLANAQSLNLLSLTDLLTSLLNDSLENLNPFHTSWIKTYADILFTKNHTCDSIKYFLEIFVAETKFFLKQNF